MICSDSWDWFQTFLTWCVMNLNTDCFGYDFLQSVPWIVLYWKTPCVFLNWLICVQFCIPLPLMLLECRYLWVIHLCFCLYFPLLYVICVFFSDSPLPVSSRVCFVKFHDPDSAVVAQHLTNTVFVDRALIVVPYAEGLCFV